MLKTILLCAALVLAGIGIGIQIAIIALDKHLKDYDKLIDRYGTVIDWICHIPVSCYNEEFKTHIIKLRDILKSEDKDA